MANLSGNAGGSKQNSNLSISLTSGNLVSQLKSIQDQAKLSNVKIEELAQLWNKFQNDIKNGEMSQKVAFDAMENHLEDYGISIDNTTKSFDKQKEKIKDVEIQSKESVKEEIKDQENYADSIDRVNQLLQEQANLLNKYKLSKTNQLTGNDIDKVIAKIGNNLNSGKKNDKIKNDILRSIAYAGTYDNYYDNKPFYDYLINKGGKPKDFNTFATSGKYKYNSDISKGLKDPNILPDINDLLAMAILNSDEFENYAKSQPDYKDLTKNYERFQARLWNSGTFKGNSQDFVDMTDIADRYLTRGIDNKNAFMNALGIDNTSLRQKALQAKDDIIKTLETGIYEKAIKEEGQILEDFSITDYSPNTFKQLPTLNYVMDYENRMRRRGRELYNLENNYTYENDSLNLPAVVEGTYREITNNVDKINQATQQTANEIVTKAQQATPAIDQATQELENTSNKVEKSIGSAFGMIVKIIQKTKNDLTLTFRDIGNATRTMSSVMYSAIHLAQALENTMNISDSMTAIAYRLDRYDNTGVSRNVLLSRAFNQANNARSDIDSYATLAQRILATGVTNGNADEAMRLSSLINKSMVLGGSTAQEQKSAQLQLSQALASNILGGDELRAIRENAIGFTEMLARGLSKGYEQGIFTDSNFANVQIGDLKALGKKQLLTTDIVTKAIGLMEDEINKDFSTMPELFSQTMSKLMNTFKQRLNEFNQEGKGLTRIVKLFQDLEKWLSSDKGKQALDKLMNILDSFIGFIEDLAKKIGWVLDKFSGPLTTMLQGYFAVKPYFMFGDLLFGKTDINGNSRAGLFGYGGPLKILQRLSQGASFAASLLGSQNINGENVAYGGLFQNIFSLFNKDSMTNKQATTLGYLNSLIKYSSKPITALGFEELLRLNTDISPNFIENILNNLLKNNFNIDFDKKFQEAIIGQDSKDFLKIKNQLKDEFYRKYFREGDLVNAIISNGALGKIVDEDTKYKELTELVGNTASTTAETSVGNAVTGAMTAKGGLIGKALGLAAAHPIATAIVAALGAGVIARNVIDKAEDEKDLNDFLSHLPNTDNLTGLQDTDREALRNKAIDFYNKHTSGAFIGTNRLWDSDDMLKFNNAYLTEAYTRHEKYFRDIAKNTEATASNTAGTLDITDEFIRNMNDIRTRSFRGELLMNGNGMNNTFNVVVHNKSDLKDIAKSVTQMLNEGVQQYVDGNLITAPVMM